PVAAPAERVHPAHDLRVEPEAATESEPPPVRAADRDAARPPGRKRLPEPARGRPSTRGRTLVPPPGRNPSGTLPSAPFSASLKPPSPEKTKIASASVTA